MIRPRARAVQFARVVAVYVDTTPTCITNYMRMHSNGMYIIIWLRRIRCSVCDRVITCHVQLGPEIN